MRDRGSQQDEDPYGEATRRVGPVTGAAGSEDAAIDRTSPPAKPRGSWRSYRLEPLIHFAATFAGGFRAD